MATSPITTESQERGKRMRSPAYPFINLGTAIRRAREFYDKEQRNAASLRIAAKHWGYEAKSSGGLQTAAAMLSFGLMEDEGTGEKRTIKLSKNALKIILDGRPDSTERAHLIKQAALTPKIHAQLWKRWGVGLPSPENLRHTLMFDWETPFNENTVDTFIKEYKDTIAFAKLSESDSLGAEVKDSGETDAYTAQIASGPTDAKPTVDPDPLMRVPPPRKTPMQEFVVPLSDGSRAVFQWPTVLTQDDVADLKDSLKILERKITRSSSDSSKIDSLASGRDISLD